MAPAAAWRRALTVIHEACITVRQANRIPLHILFVATGLSEQPVAAQAAPGRHPGLSAPKRKTRSQSRLRPRKLRVIRLSLRSCRVAAACRLRRSYHRHRGPVSLPRPAVPFVAAVIPPHVPSPPQSPPPATPRGILRSCSAATPQPTLAKRRAIFSNQSARHYQSRPPYPRLLDPAYSLRINQKGVRFAHVALLPPCVFRPQGRTLGFCCGARLARVVAPAKEGWGLHPMPRFSRAKPAAAAIRRKASPPSSNVYPACKRSLKAAGVQNLAGRFRAVDRADNEDLFALGSSTSHHRAVCLDLRGSAFPCSSSSHQPTPCEARLFTPRPKTAYVFSAAPRTSSSAQPPPADGHGLSVHLPRPPPVAKCGSFAECSHMQTRASP